MPTADAQDEDGPENAGESAEQNSGARTLPTTPKKASNVQEASNSAPARTKAAPKKNEATLLNDFLRGKPSTNRPRRRNSAIKRTAVKASAVRQLRPPGRVNERVRQWQKASAGATPPDVHGVEVEQPSEEKDGLSEGQSPNLKEAVEATDPLPQLASAQAAKTTKLASSPANGITDEKAAPVLGSDPTHDRKETGQKTKPKARKRKSDGLEATMPPRARGAPIKRVVSDSHWVNKTAVKKPAVKSQDPLLRMFAGPMAAKRAPSRKKPVVTSLPKDFTETNNANPPTERKIQDWIQRSMQLPSSTPNKKASPVDKGASKSPSRKPAAKSLPEDHLESNKANPTPEKKIQDWVERNARRSSSSLSDESKSPNQPPMPLAKKRIKTSQRHHLGGESSGAGTDDIVVEVFSATGDDATSIKETKAAGRMPFREADFASRRAMFTEMRPEKRKEDRRSAQDGVTSDGSKTYAAANRFATLPRRKAEAASLSSSVDRERQSREREISALNGLAFVSTKNTKAADESPDLGRRSRPVSQTLKSGNQQYRRRQARATRAKSLAETSLSSLTSESDNSLSDTTYKPRRNQSQRVSRDERRKSFDEIPVGHSAFSVLEFPTKEGQRRSSARREKPQRKSSLAGVPSVLKRVYNEGMKIVQDTVDPPRVVISQPPNIVSWLNQTSDPFYESNTEDREKNTPKPRQASSRKVSSSGKLHGSSSGSSGSRDFPLQSGGSTEDDTNPGDSASKHDRKKHDGDHDHDREHNRQRTTSPQSSRDDGLRTDRSSSKAYAAGLNRRPAQRDIGRSSPVERKYPRRPALSEDSAGTHTHSHNRQAHTHDRQAQPAHSPSTQQRSERPDLNSYMTGLPSTSSHKHNNLHDISYVARKRPSASPPRAPKASRRTNHAESATTGLSRSRHVSRRPQAPAFAPAPAPGLKRRLTKHSDLMSALSLPDTAKVPDRSDTIISARSLRTRRAPLETDDVQLIFAEVSADELKYKREIETLVDGVIPVLLTSALSRLDAEDADSQSPQGKLDEEKTRSIIEMGTALERIKRLHHSIPLFDAVKLACWISSFVSAYDAYLDAWRYGYEEIVVNLAPARGSTESGPTRTANGEDGTNVVDVAYLLRRPLVRVKYLARAAKGLLHARPSAETESASQSFEQLLQKVRRRTKEEHARREDILANNIDTTKARELRDLILAKNVRISQIRQVKAKEYFDLDLHHSNGQCLACQVEIIVRDSPNDDGDVLMCEVDEKDRRSLLFPPIDMSQISARTGDKEEELVIMVRGSASDGEWAQTFSLKADQPEIAEEFINMFGTKPVPPPLEDIMEEIISQEYPVMTGALPPGESVANILLASTKPKRFSDSFASEVDHVYTAGEYRQLLNRRNRPSTPAYSSSEAKQFEELRNKKSLTSDGELPPTPPAHKQFVAAKSDRSVPRLQIDTANVKRRTSSPLKHEYQPSQHSSPLSSSDYTTDSYDSDSSMDYTDTATDSEATSAAITSTNPSSLSLNVDGSKGQVAKPKLGDNGFPPAVRRSSFQTDSCVKFTAAVYYWLDSPGRWLDLQSGPLSICITPGLIEVFELENSSSRQYEAGLRNPDKQHLLALPISHQARVSGLGLDVTIRSWPLPSSKLKSSAVVRFRASNTYISKALYAAINSVRRGAQEYELKMREQQAMKALRERQLAEYEAYELSQSRFKRMFGRTKSYRASVRAPQTLPPGSTAPTTSSTRTMKSRMEKLLGLSRRENFNIERSTIYESSDYIPLHARGPPSFWSKNSTRYMESLERKFDANNLTVRVLYEERYDNKYRWLDMGDHKLVIGPPDDRPPSTVSEGLLMRVQLLRPIKGNENMLQKIDRFRRSESDDDHNKKRQKYRATFDANIGSRCFTLMSLRGIHMQVWNEMKGTNGEIGQAPAFGGVSGNHRRWVLQCSDHQLRNFIWNILSTGGGPLVAPELRHEWRGPVTTVYW